MSEVACWMGFNTKILKYFEMFPASMSLRNLLLSSPSPSTNENFYCFPSNISKQALASFMANIEVYFYCIG